MRGTNQYDSANWFWPMKPIIIPLMLISRVKRNSTIIICWPTGNTLSRACKLVAKKAIIESVNACTPKSPPNVTSKSKPKIKAWKMPTFSGNAIHQYIRTSATHCGLNVSNQVGRAIIDKSIAKRKVI